MHHVRSAPTMRPPESHPYFFLSFFISRPRSQLPHPQLRVHLAASVRIRTCKYGLNPQYSAQQRNPSFSNLLPV